MILFRICLASPSESSGVQLDKDLTVLEQVDNVQESINPQVSLNEVLLANPSLNCMSISELASIDSDNADRMDDFDSFDDDESDLEFIETPFGGIVRCGPNAKQLINDNSFPNQHLLTLKSDYSALEFAIKQYLFCGSSDLLTQQMRNRKIVLTQMWKDDGTGLIWAAMIIDTYGLVHVCVNPRTKAVKVVLSRHSVVFGHAL